MLNNSFYTFGPSCKRKKIHFPKKNYIANWEKKKFVLIKLVMLINWFMTKLYYINEIQNKICHY